MIIGNDRKQVISNIEENVKQGEYNKKVELGDPNLTSKQKDELLKNYLTNRQKISYKVKNKLARMITSFFTFFQNIDTKIVGIENVKDIKTGAIITSNHFNPLDNTVIRKFAKNLNKNKLYIVIQETNLAMSGIIGFLMNHTDNIPISDRVWYMKKDFQKIIKETLRKDNYILIYPEQEMWFNYRKPRPLKTGAYYYAAKNNVPIISCFVEIIDKDKKDTEEFKKVKYVLHILPPIYPDKEKTTKDNSIIMMQKDYEKKSRLMKKHITKN